MVTTRKTILITGAAGFIAGHLAHVLSGYANYQLILSDDFSAADKTPNWSGLNQAILIPRDVLIDRLEAEGMTPDWVIHLGARTDTTEFDYAVHEKLNLHYSQAIWEYCCRHQIPLIYASSAATYGDGRDGYSDADDQSSNLHPLNPYGLSKHQFDCWAKEQAKHPPHWFGLKFFNVYGFREAHKGRMASMVYHGYNQIRSQGFVRLFKSHRPEYVDGGQQRDFIYVKDLVRVIQWLMEATPNSGIYNLGTGVARSFNDLIGSVFQAMGLPVRIEYIDMPSDLRESYQYYTQATMEKLRKAGYPFPFYTLEEGVFDYVQQYLMR
ncbi:MAG: ADP-glyceromanno-heptose 6-epimerase [Bacteroidota bacterium]|jgi:ADP-L-glycero-D-manno-heptose 6-epimerase